MDDRIIISMTSYPKRIQFVAKVWFSIIRQIKPEYNCRCVLVLAEPEFPNRTDDLPSDLRLMISHGLIELLWTKFNTKSHKKLMPVLEKYPDDSILIVDDDQYRPDGWLKIFIDDHKKWPHDVLTGLILHREVNRHFVINRIQDAERGTVIINGRPQNGRGGTLYPPHVFTDKEFFDQNLYMKLSPTSDESWQYFFMRRHNIWPRATSKWINDVHLVVTEAQSTALWETNRGKYDSILKNMMEYFHEPK